MPAPDLLAQARAAHRARREKVQAFAFDARLNRVIEPSPGPAAAKLTWECLKTITFNGEAIRVDQVYDIAPAPDGEKRPAEAETTIWSAGFRKRYFWNRQPNELRVRREEISRVFCEDPLLADMIPDFLDRPEIRIEAGGFTDRGDIAVIGEPAWAPGKRFRWILDSRRWFISSFDRIDAAGAPVLQALLDHQINQDADFELVGATIAEAAGKNEAAPGSQTRVGVSRLVINPSPPRSFFLVELPRGTMIIDEDSGESCRAGETIDADRWLRDRERNRNQEAD